MRRHLVLLALAFLGSTLARNAVAEVRVSPDDGCPTSDAIATNLEGLGALALLAQLGTAEVRVQESSLQIFFRDRRGESLGVRVVTATSDCRTRAALAAAVIAAFVGDWAQTRLADAASPATAAAPPAETNRPQPIASSTRPWQAELGAMAFGIHDGDAGGFGFGVQANLNRGAYLACAQMEGTLNREQPLGGGQGAYGFLRAGLGFGVRQQWTYVFWDGAVIPMVERLSLHGKNVIAPKDATDWGFVLAGHTALGWNAPHFRPFLFVGASYVIPSQRMTLVETTVKVPLSSVNIQAGLGISLRIWP